MRVSAAERPADPAGTRGCELSRPRPSGAAFSREPGLCDALFSPVLTQETKPYTDEKERVCTPCAALSGGSVVPVSREAASPLSKAVEEEEPARIAGTSLQDPRSRDGRDRVSRCEGEVLVETGCWLPFHAISRTSGTFQAKEQHQEGAVGDQALWDWRW